MGKKGERERLNEVKRQRKGGESMKPKGHLKVNGAFLLQST